MAKHLIAQMNDLIKIQKDSITDEYMRGMYNGMVFMKSLVDGKEPRYIEANKKPKR